MSKVFNRSWQEFVKFQPPRQGFPLTVSRDPETPNFSGGIPNMGSWVFLRDTCFLRQELHLSFGKYVKRIKNEVFAVKINFLLVLHLSILLFYFISYTA